MREIWRKGVNKMRLNRMQRALVLAITVLLLGGLAGCGRIRIQLGWVASDQPGHFVASYALFSGSEARAIGARAGETLIVDYDSRWIKEL